MDIKTPYTALMDGVALNAAHPTSFQIPSPEEIEGLKQGKKIVKIGLEVNIPGHDIEAERFWVKILDYLEDGTIHVRVDNTLVCTEYHGIKYEDELIIEYRHILGIFTGS